MRHVKIWMFAAILTISGLVLNACSNDDNGITDPTEQLQNGEWTGGLHGANRLGGNGVADIVVNGRLAGITASKRCRFR